MATPAQEAERKVRNFCKHWQSATDDNNLTLHGFRRFKTTHLLNLRILEEEIAEIDHIIYQTGLSLGIERSPIDRLGLNHSKRDSRIAEPSSTLTRELILKLRGLLKEYDEGLAAFNNIMSMETFSLLDDEKQSSLRTDLSLYEIYNTRLLRVDLATRARTDPFQRHLHKWLRAFRYWRLSRIPEGDREALASFKRRHHRWSYQNTVLIASIIGRVISTIITAVFLITPLAVLSQPSARVSRDTQLAVVSLSILAFSFLVAAMLRISNFEMIALSAAYAAVLSAFMSNVS